MIASISSRDGSGDLAEGVDIAFSAMNHSNDWLSTPAVTDNWVGSSGESSEENSRTASMSL
jgi:hypothetical protein